MKTLKGYGTLSSSKAGLMLWGCGMFLVFPKCPFHGDEERQKPTLPPIYFIIHHSGTHRTSRLCLLLTQSEPLLMPSTHFHLKALFYLSFVPEMSFFCTPQPTFSVH